MVVELEAARGTTEPAVGSPVGLGHRTRWSPGEVLLEATGPSLGIVLDEGGLALAELTAGRDAGAPASQWEPIDLDASDPDALAVAWLGELMRQAEAHHAQLVDVTIDVAAGPQPDRPGWRVRGRAGLRHGAAPDAPAQPVLWPLPSSRVTAADGTWTLQARLQPSPGGRVGGPADASSDGRVAAATREPQVRAG